MRGEYECFFYPKCFLPVESLVKITRVFALEAVVVVVSRWYYSLCSGDDRRPRLGRDGRERSTLLLSNDDDVDDVY